LFIEQKQTHSNSRTRDAELRGCQPWFR